MLSKIFFDWNRVPSHINTPLPCPSGVSREKGWGVGWEVVLRVLEQPLSHSCYHY